MKFFYCTVFVEVKKNFSNLRKIKHLRDLTQIGHVCLTGMNLRICVGIDPLKPLPVTAQHIVARQKPSQESSENLPEK